MPFEGYGRKTDKSIDGAAIAGLIGLIQGAPSLEQNPAAGATKPGDVDWHYDGDPSDAMKKYGVGPLKNPTFAQSIAYPTLSSKVQGVNAEYAATPHMESQRFAIQQGQAAQIAKDAIEAAGGVATPDAIRFAVASHGNRIVGSGLSSKDIGAQQEGTEEIRLGVPKQSALNKHLTGQYDEELGQQRLNNGSPKLQADYEKAHNIFGRASSESGTNLIPSSESAQIAQNKHTIARSESDMRLMDAEERLKKVQTQNSMANELHVVPSRIMLAEAQVRDELGREPLEAEVRQRILENEKVNQNTIVPAQHGLLAGQLAQEQKDQPLSLATQHNTNVQKNVLSRQAPNESNPRLFDVNAKYDQNSPVNKAYRTVGTNPAYVSQFAKFGPMMSDVERMQNGGAVGGQGGMLSLPGGMLAIPAPQAQGAQAQAPASTPAPRAVVRPPSVQVSPQSATGTTNSPFLADHIYDRPAPGGSINSYPIGSPEQMQALSETAGPTMNAIAQYLYKAFNLRGQPVAAQ